jgi:hypothetical protein
MCIAIFVIDHVVVFYIPISGREWCLRSSPLDPSSVGKQRARVRVPTLEQRKALQTCAQLVDMAKTQEERVDFALSELVERTIPFYPDEDPETAENRLDEAYTFAREILGR